MAEAVTGSFFRTLGVVPALGRPLGEDDDRAGAGSAAVVLSHDAWQRRFSGSADIIGRELRLSGRLFVVVGVAPREFRGLVPGFGPELWLPIHSAVMLPTGVTIALGGTTPGVERTADRAQRWVWVTARRRPDSSDEHASAEVAVIAAQLGREHPDTNRGRGLTAVPARGVRFLPGLDRVVWAVSLFVMAVFALGLLLASVNLASLFLARALGRRREIALRLALGAARRRIVRQLFLEGVLLALLGAALGLVVAAVLGGLFGRVGLPMVSGVSWPLDLVLAPALNVRSSCFAAVAAVLTAVVFALAPALEATHADLSATLRELGAGAFAGSPPRLRAALVGTQVAVSLVLLVAAGVALRVSRHAARLDPGFDPGGVAFVTLSPDLLGYDPQATDALFEEARERLAALPGVSSVALASHLPLTAAINLTELPTAGGPAGAGTLVDSAAVGPAYFEAMRIRLLAGRPFTPGDAPSAPRVVIVNEALARRLWPDALAVGRRLGDGAEVVGVVRDGKYRTLGEDPRAFLYTSLAQDHRGTRTIVIRTAGDPRPLLAAIRDTVRAVDGRVPMSAPRTAAQVIDTALFVPRAAARLLGAFGALGLALAALGVLGVIAYLARARTREIGVRLSLGASRRAILWWLLRQALAPVAAGLGAGAVAAVGAAWTFSRLMAAAWPLDPYVLLAGGAVLTAVAFAAALLPAWRAANLEAASALRHE
jgi:predicted permease